MTWQLNWIDTVCAAIFIWLGLLGVFLGLAKAFFNLLSLIGAAAGLWFFTTPLTQFLQRLFGLQQSGAILRLVVGVFLFLVLFFTIRRLGKGLHEILHKNSLGIFNRLGGLLFGGLKAALLCGVFLSLLQWIPPEFIEPHRQRAQSWQWFQVLQKQNLPKTWR